MRFTAAGKLELELVPQGNLAERIRAAGAGIGAFFCPPVTAPSWPSTRKPARSMASRYVLECPIYADVALIKAERADRWGNLTYRKAARNFGRSWRWPRDDDRHVHESSSWASSTRKPSSRPASSSTGSSDRPSCHGGRRFKEGGADA